MNETNAEKPFNFSETAIEFIKETALANHSDAFFAFPSSQRTETDSIRFQALFPATIPSSVPLVVRFTVSGQGKTAIDTSIQVFAGPLARPLITCPPLPAGRYAYTASITKGARFTCVDSLTVEKDRSEQLIGGQNVLMMSAFMQPLAIDDSSAIRAFLTNRKTAVNENTLISEVFQIRRTWVLLIFLFLLFGAEWLLRRRMHLD